MIYYFCVYFNRILQNLLKNAAKERHFMCTAVTFLGKNSYFGRNLDFEHGFGEQVVITPRNYPFSFCSGSDMPKHFAIIGMAAVDNEYPLYYDGTNEWGLSMAGLYFPGNAVYLPA